MRYIFTTMLFLFIPLLSQAQELPNFGSDVTVVKSFGRGNATCFLYPNNNYKCACSQLRSGKKEIWSNVPMEKMNGQLSTGSVYVYAKRCADNSKAVRHNID
ncbi:MAG: hypothetical protein J6Y91_03765 [Alphaproteobacteria bacterium]|nr:hypothetical protein [Alphaproteobacteria bacterium]